MDTPQALTKTRVLELADAVLRWWWTVVAGVCLGMAVSILFLEITPKQYEASTKIFAAATKIPNSYIRTTVTDDTEVRLRALRDAVLSRPYMVRLIEEAYGMPADRGKQEALIASVRYRVSVFYSRGARFFEIRFRDTSPARAAKVANFLADLYIKENARFRATRAGEATKTMEDLAREKFQELKTREKAVAAFKARHPHELANQLEANLQILKSRKEDLQANLEEQAAASQRIEALRAQQSQKSLVQTYGASEPETAPELLADARLAQFRAELEDLRLRYSEEHPDVVAKKRQIDDLLASMGAHGVPRSGGEGRASGGPPTSDNLPKLNVWDTQIRAARLALAQLQEEEKRILSDVALYERRIENTPVMEQRLSELSEGLGALRQKYGEYVNKLESAKGAQRVEEEQQGSQFEVIDVAVPPALPVWPKPFFILGIGILVGVALLVGPVVVRHLIRPMISSEAGLTALSELPVLASIPPIPSPETARRIWRRRIKNLALSAVSFIILVAAIAAHYVGKS